MNWLIIFLIFILLILFKVTKPYINAFTSYQKPEHLTNNKLMFSKADGTHKPNPNNICLVFANKTLNYNKDSYLTLENIGDGTLENEIKNNNGDNIFRIINISESYFAIYHPNTKCYLFVDNPINENIIPKLYMGQLNILKPENLNIVTFIKVKSKFQHKETGLYLLVKDNKLVLNRNKGTKVKIVDASIFNNRGSENFNVGKTNSKDKKNVEQLVQNGLLPSSLMPCNIESFEDSVMQNSNDVNNANSGINIFNPNVKLEYKKLFKSFGKNLFKDDLENITGDNVTEYLSNYHMTILNKNIELQKLIDSGSVKIENTLNEKTADLELLKLYKDAMTFYQFNDK